MPIQLLPEDANSRDGALENKIFQYLLEPLTINPEIISARIQSSGLLIASETGIDKLGETIWTFLYGTPRDKRIANNPTEKEAVGLAYNQEPEKTTAMIDRLHELIHIDSGNKALDDAVKYYTKNMMDHFSKSQSLLEQISITNIHQTLRTNRDKLKRRIS